MNKTVNEAIADLEPGAKVRLRLSDGREVSGQLREKSADSVRLANTDAVKFDDVDGVFLEFARLGGPE